MGQKSNPVPVAYNASRAFHFRVVKTETWNGVDADWLYDFEWKRIDEEHWHTNEAWFEENKNDFARDIRQWLGRWGITV